MFCWFYKFMISHTLDKDKRPSPITERHILHCEDCRQFYKTCQSLGERLTREALISNSRTSTRLNEHILRAISSRRTEKHRVSVKFWIRATAACLTLFVLIGAMLLVLKRNGQNNVQPRQHQMDIAIQELMKVYDQVGRDLPANWPQLIERPLAGEYQRLANDTQSAVRFLVACVDVDISRLDGGTLN